MFNKQITRLISKLKKDFKSIHQINITQLGLLWVKNKPESNRLFTNSSELFHDSGIKLLENFSKL